MNDPGAPLTWRSLTESDLSAIVELAGNCRTADGGQPFAADAGFVRQCYLTGAQTYAGFAGGALVCASALRRPAAGTAGGPAVTSGLVHPDWRRRGLGTHAFGWARDQAGPGALRAESEALSEGAHALYLGHGLAQIMAEDVMQLAAGAGVPPVRVPTGLTLRSWDQAGPARFFPVYDAAFRDRPGFPGWSQEQWASWIADDEDFRPQWTLLATLDGHDVAFVAAEATGWIAQVGVVPDARGQGLGAALIAEAVTRMRSAGETTVTLNVNVNNPHAAALYRRLGFVRTGRRARYQTPA